MRSVDVTIFLRYTPSKRIVLLWIEEEVPYATDDNTYIAQVKREDNLAIFFSFYEKS